MQEFRKCPTTGHYIGYHVSEGPLDTVVPDTPSNRILFIGSDPKEWYPSYLTEEVLKDYKIYKVLFKVHSRLVFESPGVKEHFNTGYHGLFRNGKDDGPCELRSKSRTMLNNMGVGLVELKSPDELHEGFIGFHKDHIVSIEEMSVTAPSIVPDYVRSGKLRDVIAAMEQSDLLTDKDVEGPTDVVRDMARTPGLPRPARSLWDQQLPDAREMSHKYRNPWNQPQSEELRDLIRRSLATWVMRNQ